jgi:hypothetical protein
MLVYCATYIMLHYITLHYFIISNVYLFIYLLFNNVLDSAVYTALNLRANKECSIERNIIIGPK